MSQGDKRMRMNIPGSIPISNAFNPGTNVSNIVSTTRLVTPYKEDSNDQNSWIHEFPLHSILLMKKNDKPSNHPVKSIVLNVVQVNYVLRKEWLANETMNPKEFYEKVCSEWSYAGFCLTPPDPLFNASKSNKARHIVCGLTGPMDCENLWDSDLLGGNYCWLALMMVQNHEKTSKYKFENNTSKDVDNEEEEWCPQFVAVHTVQNKLIPGECNAMFLIGICEINYTDNKMPKNPQDFNKSHPVTNMKEIKEKSRIRMNFFF
jgi:hypothetical protein